MVDYPFAAAEPAHYFGVHSTSFERGTICLPEGVVAAEHSTVACDRVDVVGVGGDEEV